MAKTHNNDFSNQDKSFMCQALQLASDGLGRVAPNPSYERDGLNYIVVEDIVEDLGIVNLTHEDYDVVPPFAIPEPKE